MYSCILLPLNRASAQRVYSVSPQSSNEFTLVPGSIQKICQVTGDTDLEFNQPTMSLTQTRYGLVRADHGYSFEHNGKLFFLFGDTHPTPKFNGYPDTQTDTPRVIDDNDAIGYVSDSSTGPCLKLDFITNSIGAYKNPVVLNALGKPAIKLRTNESPISGISDGGRMYVTFGTDNPIDTVSPPAPLGHPASSVLAVSDDDGNTFHYLYYFSRKPNAKFVQTGIAKGQDGYIYFWGTQDDTMYRKSACWLARKPEGRMIDSTAIEYLHSVNSDGSPIFMPTEQDAQPLFHDSLPDGTGKMQVADAMSEIGIEWNPYVQRWVMLYNCLNHSLTNPRGIWMRFAKRPWGPWSAPQTIFNPVQNNGYCYFMHRVVNDSTPQCDNLSGSDRLADPGGEYGPYFISRFTTGDVTSATSTFYFTLDTWNPYTQVIMQASIQRVPLADTAGIPRPTGMYVMDDVSNERSASAVYVAGLDTSHAYLNDITGDAIFVPIAKILPSITTWGVFNWTWGYLDSLVQFAVSHGKKFSIELETGFQSSSTYLQALPAGFLTLAGASSAPLFNVWVTGGSGGRGTSAYIPLPWVPKVQEFWSATAYALAAHLQQTGAYGSLTLVHIPGLSVYDEELRLPTGYPKPTLADTQACPDGRPAYPSVITDADTSRWRALGYSDSAVINGFTMIATAFAQAFPDRFLGLSLFPLGVRGIDFPNLTGDSVGYVAAQIVQAVNAIAPGRVQIQSDNLDANVVDTEITSFASLYSDFIGWQTNKHANTGAGCNGGAVGSCNPDGPDSPYFQLLQSGWMTGGKYIEVWASDVVNYPQSLDAAKSMGFFPTTGVTRSEPFSSLKFELSQNYPNPFNPSTNISFTVPSWSFVSLKVFDLLGREVATLVNEQKSAGTYTQKWNASALSSGVYFYKLEAGNYIAAKKLLLLR
jgi:hypothetical protein